MKRPEWNKIGSCVVTAVFVVLLVAVGVLQKTARTEVDVILFAGQSNMSGVGAVSYTHLQILSVQTVWINTF